MADKEPEEKDDLIKPVKKTWAYFIGFVTVLSTATSLFNFYQLWLGNQETLPIFLLLEAFYF